MIKNLLFKFNSTANKTQDFSLFVLRLILAYGFWEPAKTKWADISSVVEWFEGMGMFAPKLNAYLAASTEMAGVFLLVLGLGTRLISIPLIITMLVAIKMVHFENGFLASDNGYEIALYYVVMLLILISFGPGKWSVDFFIKKSDK